MTRARRAPSRRPRPAPRCPCRRHPPRRRSLLSNPRGVSTRTPPQTRRSSREAEPPRFVCRSSTPEPPSARPGRGTGARHGRVAGQRRTACPRTAAGASPLVAQLIRNRRSRRLRRQRRSRRHPARRRSRRPPPRRAPVLSPRSPPPRPPRRRAGTGAASARVANRNPRVNQVRPNRARRACRRLLPPSRPRSLLLLLRLLLLRSGRGISTSRARRETPLGPPGSCPRTAVAPPARAPRERPQPIRNRRGHPRTRDTRVEPASACARGPAGWR